MEQWDRYAVSSANLGLQFGLGFQETLAYSMRKSLHSESFNKYLIQEKLKGNATLIPFEFYRVRADGKIDNQDRGIYRKDKNLAKENLDSC